MRSNATARKIRDCAMVIAKKSFGRFGIGVTWRKRLLVLEQYYKGKPKFLLIQAIDPNPLLNLIEKSKSQIGQDLFVLNQTNYRRNGFFVEFGATNGLLNSNTYLLEKEFDWTGILAEPAKVWVKDLKNNRPNCAIETFSVWKESNSIVTFNETSDPELSTIDEFMLTDAHAASRVRRKKYDVQTISLLDLLVKNMAPKVIDYLSIDTEGSEFEILNAFDFMKYVFRVITVEHNRTVQRELIYSLLTKNGYVQKFKDVSDFDDWYVYDSKS